MKNTNRLLSRGAVIMTLIVLTACDLQQGDYIIQSDNLPDERFRPVIGNGHIATNVLSDTVYMNGLYNGQEDRSSRARIPAYIAVDVDDNTSERRYLLDMYHGLFGQTIHMHDATVTVLYFAHRKYTRLLVTQVTIRRNHDVISAVTIPLLVNKGNNSVDLTENLQEMQNEQTLTTHDSYLSLTVKDMEIPGTSKTQLHVYHTVVPANITLAAGKSNMTMTFIASHSQNKEDAKVSYKDGNNRINMLLSEHKTAWEKVWSEGRIDIEGNKDLSQTIAAATYYILCSVPDREDSVTPFFGLSPGGLSRGGLLVPSMPGGGHNDYAGHVFWDMDTWVMPSMLVFHPDIARRMIGSRTRVLDRVKENARDVGYKGAKFPWEQAATGVEATPKWAGNMSRFEIHITADIAYGLRQYLYATDDVTILTNGARGFELAMESARFWQSRVTIYKNPDRADILGVMGPDEYHGNINNSVFTNYNAKLNLLLPGYIVNNMNINISASERQEIEQFKRTAELIVILFDEVLQYHPQYEDFNNTLQIKQSDVILLGYPLMMPMTKQIRQTDLEMYERITNPEGPDTGTWSMHTVGWLELGHEDRAYKSFKMMFRNINKPFKVFSENPVTNTSNGGCVNFITAAGGLLQSVIFGYGGLRLREDRLTINTNNVPNASSWTLKGVHYRGVIFDVIHRNGHVIIEPTFIPVNTTARVDLKSKQYDMKIGHKIRYEKQEVNMYASQSSWTVMTTPASGAKSVYINSLAIVTAIILFYA